MRKAIFLFFVISSAFFPQSFDPEFWITDGLVNTMYYDATVNALYLGGSFRYVGPNTGGFTKVDNVTGSSPDLNIPKVNGTVYCIESDGSGGWYIGGDFSKVGDSLRNNVAHITSAGEVDGWNPNVNNYVMAIAHYGTSVYIAGYFDNVGGTAKYYLAKLNNTTGELDASWNPNPNNSVISLTVYNGYLYAGGNFSSIGGNSVSCFAKLDLTSGASDASWNPAPDNLVKAIATDSTYFYIGGDFFYVGGKEQKYLARVKIADGTFDTNWLPTVNDHVNALAYSGGALYLGGQFTSVNSEPTFYVAKLFASTVNVDTSWDASANDNVYGLFADSDAGLLYIGGPFNKLNNVRRYGIGRVGLSNGVLDNSWNPEVHNNGSVTSDVAGLVYAIGKSGNNIYFGGRFISCGGKLRTNLAKFINGSLDPDWQPAANSEVKTIILDGEDVYVGGCFTEVNNITRNHIAKLNKNTGVLESWNPDIDYEVYALQANSSYLFVGGNFWTVGGSSVSNLVKLKKSDGTLVSAWKPDPNGAIYSLALDGGYLYAGGSYSTISGSSFDNLARIDTGTAVPDNSWKPDPNSSVTALTLTSSNVYVGGYFSNIGGESISSLAKLNKTDASPVTSLNPSPNNAVLTIFLDGTDLYVGGKFTLIGGGWHKYFAKLNETDGSVKTDFAPEFDYFVEQIIVLPGSKIYMCGQFNKMDLKPSNGIASFGMSAAPVELVSFTATTDGNEITLNWQTATEINNYGFQVERKKSKGESSWEEIGFVEGAGNSNSPKAYSFTDNVTESGTFSYRLKQIDLDGSYKYSNVVEVNVGTPSKFELMQNYPNPFNPTTTIKYSIPSVIARSEATKQSHDFASNVQLNVYNILGEEIATLVNEKQSPGNYTVQFDASNLPSGVYFYTLRVGDFVATKKMILMK